MNILTKLNEWRRNMLFITAAEAQHACSLTFSAGQKDTASGFARGLLDLTSHKIDHKKSQRIYDIRLCVDATALETAAGDIPVAVIIAEDIATRIVAQHRGRKVAK